jgi:hypothetical protein
VSIVDRPVATDDLERRLRSWMSEQGPDADLTPAYEAIVGATRSAAQRPWFLVRRGRRMTAPVSAGWFVAQRALVIVIALALLAIALTGTLLVGGHFIQGPPPRLLDVSSVDVPLGPGAYAVGRPFGAPFSVGLASDWTLKQMALGDTQFTNTDDPNASGAAWLVVDLLDDVYADPCRSGGGPMSPPVAPTIDEIATALTHMAGYSAGPLTDAMIGGYPAKAVEVTNSIATDSVGCDGGAMLPMWTFRGGGSAATNGFATEHLWVVDVNGTIVIVDGETFPTTPRTALDEVRWIVSTMRFDH